MDSRAFVSCERSLLELSDPSEGEEDIDGVGEDELRFEYRNVMNFVSFLGLSATNLMMQ
jgi:hypothetical protein